MNLALTDEHRKIVRAILSEYLPANVNVRAFGSRAKNTHRTLSDLDLAILGDAPLSLSQLADLAEAFSESDLPFKVDVVDWRSVSPFCNASSTGTASTSRLDRIFALA